MTHNEFQFPSSGKAYSNLSMVSILLCIISFNSLQAGKPIQTQIIKETIMSLILIGFNSLQAGKPIQTDCMMSSRRAFP